MSRVAKKPVNLPQGVTVTVAAGVTVPSALETCVNATIFVRGPSRFS